MKSVRIADLKAKLSSYVRAAERGERIQILDRNRPIAQLGPLDDGPDDIELIPPVVGFKTLRGRRVHRARWAESAERALMTDRRKR